MGIRGCRTTLPAGLARDSLVVSVEAKNSGTLTTIKHDGFRMIVNRWQAPTLTPGHKHEMLQQALVKAWRAPFFARKLRAAGFHQEDDISEFEWDRLPLTTKDELRLLSPAEFCRDVVIAPRTEIADYWRSGGVTGKPLFYPRTWEDEACGVETFRRVLDMAGVGPGDLVANSYPLGIHPLGRIMLLAMQAQGCTTLGTGAGNSTPTDQQIELIIDQKVDYVMAMGTYALQLTNRALQLGLDLLKGNVKSIISCSDLITPAKRSRIKKLWGAELFDSYGMSEAGHLGCECELHDGMHAWADLYHLEVIDEVSLTPVLPGEVGVLVVTPLYTNHATPFIRWVSGDLVSLQESDCNCRSPYSHLPILRLAGRTIGFFKIRGVNVNHRELEDLLLANPDVADYRVIARMDGDREVMEIEVEPALRANSLIVSEAVKAEVGHTFGLVPTITITPMGLIAAELQTQVKQTRVFDRRYSATEVAHFA